MKLNTLIGIISALTFAGIVFGDLPYDKGKAGDRATKEELYNFKQQRILEDELNWANASEIPLSEHPANHPCEERMEADFFFTNAIYHPGTNHVAINVAPKGDSIELEDGSIWTVDSSDYRKTLDWLRTDTIKLTPNHSWFSSFSYILTNLSTQASIAVNLASPPDPASIYLYKINTIDTQGRTLTLSDGSIWEMSWFDGDIIAKWQAKDIVILGHNDGWWKEMNPHILLNISLLQHARGARIK